MRAIWVVIALAAACCATTPTFGETKYQLVIGQSRFPVDATFRALAKWVESRGGHLIYRGKEDPTSVLTFEIPIADPTTHSLKDYADCGSLDMTLPMQPISLLRVEVQQSSALGTMVQFMAIFEEFLLDTMRTVEYCRFRAAA